MTGLSTLDTVSTKLLRIAELAKQMPSAQMRSLSRHIDVEWLREAHRRVRKDGAVGVYGQTVEEYAKNLESNLQSLLNIYCTEHYGTPLRLFPVKKLELWTEMNASCAPVPAAR